MTVETYSALSAYLSNLAKKHDLTLDASFGSQITAKDAKPDAIVLPGPDTPEKANLERELVALTARIQYLEAKANVDGNIAFPITPDEPTPPFPYAPAAVPAILKRDPPERSGVWEDRRLNNTGNWPAGRKSDGGYKPMASLAEDNKQLNNQRVVFEQAMGMHKLDKQWQANLAFQKASRESTNIVTAVSMSDPSNKALVDGIEMGPDIMNFKRAINENVHKLQELASQITHLAKEVGTEQQLGGRVSVPGVYGIWAECAGSGMTEFCVPLCFYRRPNNVLCRKRYGKSPNGANARNGLRNRCCHPRRLE